MIPVIVSVIAKCAELFRNVGLFNPSNILLWGDFHMGELRLEKIRQLGQDRGTETGKQKKTLFLAYGLNK